MPTGTSTNLSLAAIRVEGGFLPESRFSGTGPATYRLELFCITRSFLGGHGIKPEIFVELPTVSNGGVYEG